MPRLLLFLFFVFITSSCKKCDDPCNKECDNYDPCCGLTELTADFKIIENIHMGSDWIAFFGIMEIETDTILQYNRAVFRASGEADEYEWVIGNDPRVWTEKEFFLSFGSLSHGEQVDITLTVRRTTNLTCLEDGVFEKSYTKTLTVYHQDSAKIFGEYLGRNQSYPETLIPASIRSTTTIGLPVGGGTIDGVIENCEDIYFNHSFWLAYSHFYFTTRGNETPCCYMFYGRGYIDDKNRLVVDYSHFPLHKNHPVVCEWRSFYGVDRASVEVFERYIGTKK
jgi:hypothetical protein